MNIVKYSLLLFLALSIGSQQLSSSILTPPPPPPADPFLQGGTILSDFTILSNAVNQDLTNSQNLSTAIYFLLFFINDYMSFTPTPTITSTALATMGDQFVTLIQTVWTALCKNLAPAFTGTIQTTFGQSANCPTSDTMSQIGMFGTVLDCALTQPNGVPIAFLSSNQQQATLQGINGTQPATPSPTAPPTPPQAPASDKGTVNGVMNNYFYLCPIITTGMVSGGMISGGMIPGGMISGGTIPGGTFSTGQNNQPPQVITNTKTIVLTKGKSASSVAINKSTKTVVVKKGTSTITTKPVKQATITKVVKPAAKK